MPCYAMLCYAMLCYAMLWLVSLWKNPAKIKKIKIDFPAESTKSLKRIIHRLQWNRIVTMLEKLHIMLYFIQIYSEVLIVILLSEC